MVKLIREQTDFWVAFSVGNKRGSGYWWIFNRDERIGVPSPIICELFAEKFDNKVYPELVAFGV